MDSDQIRHLQVDGAVLGSIWQFVEEFLIMGCDLGKFMCKQSRKILSNSSIALPDSGH